ncbi:MAG: lysophospholipid acyltransferase family protein [Candidatus Limnocylindrales bacterium]
MTDQARAPEPLRDDITPFIGATMLVARTSLRCLTRVRLDGALDAIPRSGPLIVAANHLSNADGVLLGGWLTPALGRRVHWLGKREMVEWPVLGGAVRAISVHPVDRSGTDVEAFRLAERILGEGHVLIVFPEGTRSPSGSLGEAKDGLALLAMRTGARILPVGITGTDRFWPKGSYPHPGGHIFLRVGGSFTVADIVPAGTDRKTAKRLATEGIMGRIAALLPVAKRGAYAEAAAGLAGGTAGEGAGEGSATVD